MIDWVSSLPQHEAIIRGLEVHDDLELKQAVPSSFLARSSMSPRVGMCSSIDCLRSPIPLSFFV